MNPLPPQAYTKETLLKAYAWLMNQSGSIREMATTPDILVSLYLKATRDGEGALDRPSIQNFKNELKSLAGLMGELDRVPQGASGLASPAVTTPSSSLKTPSASLPPSAPAGEPVGASAFPGSFKAPNGAAGNGVMTSPSPHSPPAAILEGKMSLDPQSLHMIREVKESLNLGSEMEALRMLIKIGYVRSQGLLK